MLGHKFTKSRADILCASNASGVDDASCIKGVVGKLCIIGLPSAGRPWKLYSPGIDGGR